MNWRRGFNRVYIVFVALWLIGAIALRFDHVRDRLIGNHREATEKLRSDTVALAAVQKDKIDSEWVDVTPNRAEKPLDVFDKVVAQADAAQRAEWLTRLERVRLSAVEQDKKMLAVAERELRGGAVAALLNPLELWTTVRVAIVPPALAYGLIVSMLFVIRWVTRGFRASGTQTDG